MARIAFLLLAHRDPVRLVAKANSLTAHGDYVVIHFDRRAKPADWNALRNGLADNDRVRFAKRCRCGWGMYSLVQASLNLIERARQSFADITHYYLLSGDCYPTKSRGYLDRFLTDDRDHIEVNDFFESGWIKTGLKEDRLVYRHWFNERERHWLFYKSLNLQRRFRMTREIPEELTMRIGSQWWALRAATIERLLKFLNGRKDIIRFFRTTWIPDETFFQTLVGHLIPRDQLTDKPPTHLKFTDYGMPAIFHANQGDYLRADPGAFARKISPHADALHDALLDRFEQWESDGPEGTGSTNLFGYLTQRGRHGQRYAPRFWETAIGQRRRARLLIVVSKLWHVGEAMEKAIADMTGVRRLGYLFDEDRDLDVPLGGLEVGLAKRNRHRVALLNLAFDALGTDRLMLCTDPLACRRHCRDDQQDRRGPHTDDRPTDPRRPHPQPRDPHRPDLGRQRRVRSRRKPYGVAA